MKEYEELGAKNGLRGPELIEWADYLENGGQIYPLDVLVEEGSEISFVN